MIKKHDPEHYKEMLKEIFGSQKEIMRDVLITEIMKAEKCPYNVAERIVNYCRTNSIIKSRHLYSNYFKYSLNF